jgi:hypothetical protein
VQRRKSPKPRFLHGYDTIVGVILAASTHTGSACRIQLCKWTSAFR